MRTPLPAAARRLLASRMVVSVGQGALAVDFALYARALHWSVAFLGGPYAARNVLNRGTAGQRQALVLGAVRGQRRGLAASVSGVSTQLPRALGPSLAGMLFGAGLFTAPFLLAAAFQAGYILLYRRVFAGADRG